MGSEDTPPGSPGVAPGVAGAARSLTPPRGGSLAGDVARSASRGRGRGPAGPCESPPWSPHLDAPLLTDGTLRPDECPWPPGAPGPQRAPSPIGRRVPAGTARPWTPESQVAEARVLQRFMGLFDSEEDAWLQTAPARESPPRVSPPRARPSASACSALAVAGELGCVHVPLRGDGGPPEAAAPERTAGLFVGQIPVSYGSDDVELLLRALGRAGGAAVHVGGVRMHPRKTCAFVVVDEGSRPALLGFHRRVLCDRDCAWIARDAAHAEEVGQRVQAQRGTRPASDYHGLPRAAMVLEECTRERRGASMRGADVHVGPPPPAYGAPALRPPPPREPGPLFVGHPPSAYAAHQVAMYGVAPAPPAGPALGPLLAAAPPVTAWHGGAPPGSAPAVYVVPLHGAPLAPQGVPAPQYAAVPPPVCHRCHRSYRLGQLPFSSTCGGCGAAMAAYCVGHACGCGGVLCTSCVACLRHGGAAPRAREAPQVIPSLAAPTYMVVGPTRL